MDMASTYRSIASCAIGRCRWSPRNCASTGRNHFCSGGSRFLSRSRRSRLSSRRRRTGLSSRRRCSGLSSSRRCSRLSSRRRCSRLFSRRWCSRFYGCRRCSRRLSFRRSSRGRGRRSSLLARARSLLRCITRMFRLTYILLLSTQWLSIQSALLADRGQRASIVTPDIVVIWTSALKAVLVVVEKDFVAADVAGSFGDGDGGSCKVSVDKDGVGLCFGFRF